MVDDDTSSQNINAAAGSAPSNQKLEAMLDGLLEAGDNENANDSPGGDFMDDPFQDDDAGESPKVELDIDDAPFLEEDLPPEPQKEEAKPPALPEASDEAEEEAGGLRGFLQRLLKNKKRMALVGGVALFILAAPLIFLLVSGKKELPPPEEPKQAEAPPPPEPSAQPPSLPDNRFVYESGVYLVPLRGSEGELRFLRLRYTLVMDSLNLFSELQQKSIPVRDAVYHYLSKKPLTLLSGEEQARLLRFDLINVINQQLSADKITELNFEEYLITGG